MQIKILVIGILVGCSYLIGEFIYKAFAKRHKQLHDLIRILEIIRMDLSFGLYTLEEIFQRVGARQEFSFSSFFKKMEHDLIKDEGKMLEEILEDNISILTSESYLQSKEVEEFKKLILTLGRSDVESQSRMIDLSIENLKSMTSQTQEDINKKGMVYRKLATIIGLAIGIILI